MSEGHARWVALGVACLALAMRAGGTFEFWLNGDEGIYYSIAHAPAALARAEIAHNAHPPLFYWLLRGVASLTPDYAWLRLPALLSGALLVVALYALGREIGGVATGLAAALLAALSPGAALLSQVARPYTLQALCISLALLFLLRYRSRGARRDLALYAGSLLVALLLQYGTLILLLAIGSVLAAHALAGRVRGRALLDLLLAHIPLLLTAAWLFLSHIRERLIGSPIRREALLVSLRPYFVDSPLDAWHAVLGVVAYLAGEPSAAPGLVLLAAGLVACVATRRTEFATLVLATLAWAVLFSFLRLYPLGATRHAFYLAPLLLATAAHGVGWSFALRGRALLAAGLFAVVLFTAARPLGVALGIPRPPRPLAELDVTASEVGELRRLLEPTLETPGLLIMDTATSFRMSPLLGPALFSAQKDRRGIARFRWRNRDAAVSPSWLLGVGITPTTSSLLARLAEIPELRESLRGDVRVLAYHAQSHPSPIDSLGRLSRHSRGPLFEQAIETEHFALFRLDPTRYRETFRAARGER